MNLLPHHIAKIEEQPVKTLEKSFIQLCDMEADLEHKLAVIAEVKARILITIELKTRTTKS